MFVCDITVFLLAEKHIFFILHLASTDLVHSVTPEPRRCYITVRCSILATNCVHMVESFRAVIERIDVNYQWILLSVYNRQPL